MKNTAQKYIELKVNRDFGDIITTYFEFLKQNLKNFTNVFLNYNGIFLIGLLVVSYLLVSGVLGLIGHYDFGQDFSTMSGGEEAYYIYLVVGGILLVIIFMIVALLNYSLAAAYMIQYETLQGNHFDKRQVWNFFTRKIGSIFLFIVLLIGIYMAVSIVGIILAIIPLVGVFAYYILLFFVLAWFGVSFFCLLNENKGVSEAFGEGWNLVTKNFWKSVGVNFVLGLLNGILFFIVLIIPGILLGVYTFHVVENDVDVSSGMVPTIVYTLGTCMVLLISMYSQCLSQFVNGILYYSLHEKLYNTHARSKIDQIGNLE
ncbi:hypothetical protein U1E44_02580 [Arenibacter sp. GZD96]|uniref:hypothetical protein n=1 Tax=Aurantibrevibacter litoralis TaxID=3106030 RepID=UPI002AFF7019|nr:hypothetical protein [Arenibacter sp. GZD-96]MEA1784965.1 hypothetical protein [Arenibacter sp. GZD-96]